MNQLYIHIYLLFFRFLSHLCHHRSLNKSWFILSSGLQANFLRQICPFSWTASVITQHWPCSFLAAVLRVSFHSITQGIHIALSTAWIDLFISGSNLIDLIIKSDLIPQCIQYQAILLSHWFLMYKWSIYRFFTSNCFLRDVPYPLSLSFSP